MYNNSNMTDEIIKMIENDRIRQIKRDRERDREDRQERKEREERAKEREERDEKERKEREERAKEREERDEKERKEREERDKEKDERYRQQLMEMLKYTSQQSKADQLKNVWQIGFFQPEQLCGPGPYEGTAIMNTHHPSSSSLTHSSQLGHFNVQMTSSSFVPRMANSPAAPFSPDNYLSPMFSILSPGQYDKYLIGGGTTNQLQLEDGTANNAPSLDNEMEEQENVPPRNGSGTVSDEESPMETINTEKEHVQSAESDEEVAEFVRLLAGENIGCQ